MRLREAFGAERLPSLRHLARTIGERLIEWADRADQRADHESPMVILRISKQWEPKRGTVKHFTRRHQETLH